MITLHHLDNSRSQRVLWLLEELALPYKVQHYKRDPKTMLAPPALERVHPLGKSPVITDGDTTVAESGAIIEYLLDTYDSGGRLRPAAGTPERRQFTYWLHFSEGSAMPPLLMKLVFGAVPGKVPFFIRPVAKAIGAGVSANFIDPNLKRQLDFMERELSQRDWFAGTAFSAADIQMSFPLEAAKGRGVLGTQRPKLSDWLARIHARAAYRRALEVGGPYSMER